jgi:16S rRNA (guanine966-N2)-methyltransferase
LGAVRVVGGVARGRRLRAPASGLIRPTGDFVREAVFDMLGSLDGVAGARVVDLFAGTGAMGIEAASRGAAGVIFVDRHHRAQQTIRANLAGAGFGSRPGSGGPSIRVVRAEVLGWLAGPAAQNRPCDLALCDPPYQFSAWPELSAALRCGLAPAVAVLEAPEPVEPGDGWEILRVKHYGTTVVTVVRCVPQRGDP